MKMEQTFSSSCSLMPCHLVRSKTLFVSQIILFCIRSKRDCIFICMLLLVNHPLLPQCDHLQSVECFLNQRWMSANHSLFTKEFLVNWLTDQKFPWTASLRRTTFKKAVLPTSQHHLWQPCSWHVPLTKTSAKSFCLSKDRRKHNDVDTHKQIFKHASAETWDKITTVNQLKHFLFWLFHYCSALACWPMIHSMPQWGCTKGRNKGSMLNHCSLIR